MSNVANNNTTEQLLHALKQERLLRQKLSVALSEFKTNPSQLLHPITEEFVEANICQWVEGQEVTFSIPFSYQPTRISTTEADSLLEYQIPPRVQNKLAHTNLLLLIQFNKEHKPSSALYNLETHSTFCHYHTTDDHTDCIGSLEPILKKLNPSAKEIKNFRDNLERAFSNINLDSISKKEPEHIPSEFYLPESMELDEITRIFEIDGPPHEEYLKDTWAIKP